MALAAPAPAAGAAPDGPVAQGLPAPASGLLDEAGAMVQARATGRPVEVTALTSETVKVMADPTSRTFAAEVSALPVRVRDVTGAGWRPVDLTLWVKADGTVTPAVAPVELAFSGGGAVALARVADRGRWVELRWQPQIALRDRGVHASSLRSHRHPGLVR